MRSGEPAEHMCIASAAALNLSDAGYDTMMAMFNLMHTMLAGTGFTAAGLPWLDLPGIPVRFHAPTGDAMRTLVGVSHETLDDSLFEIPATFIEQTPENHD